MIRGASQKILNFQAQSAMDLVSEIKSQELARDITKMLGPPPLLDCLMLNPPTRKMKK